MNDDFLNRHSRIDDWDDFGRDDDYEGEGWKPNPAKELCKTLAKKWESIMFMLEGIMADKEKEDATDEERMFESCSSFNIGDGYQISAKLRSAYSCDMYVIYMENASIIRKNAQSIMSNMLVLIETDFVEEAHGMTIRKEIEEFRELFKEWVSNFKKDEFEDEWGLFV
jgi:hypothetical protein